MKKITLVLLVFLSTHFSFSQNNEDSIITPSKEISEPIYTEEPDYEIPFTVLEEIPNFEVCKDLKNQDARNCFSENLNKHITSNFIYPKEALEAKIQGRVVVMFIINKKGEIENIKVRGPKNGILLEQEAIRIIKALPKFSPGKQREKSVNVSYAQPFNFVLPTQSSEIKE